MSRLATTKLSSKGQVVIPESIRQQMKLGVGTEFVLLAHDDTIILKTIQPPSMTEFADIVNNARKQAKAAGLIKKDLDDAIKKVRGKKKA